jgi:hypothetical protein
MKSADHICVPSKLINQVTIEIILINAYLFYVDYSTLYEKIEYYTFFINAFIINKLFIFLTCWCLIKLPLF